MGLYGDADLVMTRDVTYTRTMQYKINTTLISWASYELIAQARDVYGSLVFDLTPYLSIAVGDPTKLVLTIPKATVQQIPNDVVWDIVATLLSDETMGFRTPNPPGRILINLGVTDLEGESSIPPITPPGPVVDGGSP